MKKRISILLLVCLANINFAYSQTRYIDSLRHALQSEMPDTVRCILLYILSKNYAISSPNSAMLAGQQGLALSKHIHFSRGEILCLSEMGTIYTNTGNDAKGLELLLLALKKSETVNYQELSGEVLLSIGNFYGDQGEPRKSLEYEFKARDIYIALHDEYNQGFCDANIGDCYEKLNQLDSARIFTERGYDYNAKVTNTYLIGLTLNNLGNIYSKMQQLAVAMANYRMGLPHLYESAAFDGICESTLGMAKLFQQLNQNDSCLYYAKLSYATAQKVGFIKYALLASTFLADYYKQHHEVDSAYTYLSVVITIKDSAFSQVKIKQIQNLSFDEKIRQQEIAVQKKMADENHIRNLQLLAIGIFIPIFFIIVLFLSRTKVKARVVEFLGILSLLLFFEFITDLIYPYVSDLTNDSALWEMLILVIVAALLEPLNYRMEHWVKERLVHKPVHEPIPVMVESIPNEAD
jgi:tetratricopeptide (TPR) repeat protein